MRGQNHQDFHSGSLCLTGGWGRQRQIAATIGSVGPWSICSRRHSGRHVLELWKVERLRPFKTALGEHLKHRLDALRVIQTAQCDEDHSWEALQVGSEHPGAALRAEVPV